MLMPAELQLADPASPELIDGMAYWERICGAGRSMPGRADIDPVDIPALLPNVFLVDVEAGRRDFRYRLLGTEIVSHSVANYTGRSLRDLPAQRPPSRIWSLFEAVVAEQRPLCALIPTLGNPEKFVEKLAMPLSDDGAAVDMLFGLIKFERSPRFRNEKPVL